jgi:hypothetical protein
VPPGGAAGLGAVGPGGGVEIRDGDEVELEALETFERWIGAQARRVFPELPRRLSEYAAPTYAASNATGE